MKGIYISVALLLAVLLIALFYMLAIANVSSSFAMAAVEVQQFIEQDNMEAAGFKVDEIEQQWRQQSHWIAVFVNHSEMEEIQYIIERMKACKSLETKSQLAAELAEFMERVKHLSIMERPNLENLL